MDTKIEIKKENPLSEDVGSENERQFFTKYVTMKKVNDAVLLSDDCDVAIKKEIKSQASFSNFCSLEDRESFIKHYLKQIKPATVTGSNNYELDTKTEIEKQTLVSDFGLQNERKCPEDPIITVKNYSSVHEINNKIEIKEESWWMEAGTSSVCDDFKNGDFPPVKSSRLCIEAESGDSISKSSFPSAENSGRGTSFYDRKDRPECGSKGSGLTHKGKRPHSCMTCGKSFTQFYNLKRHNLIHEGRKPHHCKICYKNFTQLSDVKRHILIHEGKKPHQCKSCVKSFTQLSHLKSHNLIHKGKKPYHCKTCDKRFTQLSHMKIHKLIHEGKRPHQCKTCEKSFSELSNLKRHSLIHEGNKPYQCKICDKSFTQLPNLKRHNMIHEGKKPFQCKICDNRFTQLAELKRHNLVHQGKKPHQCKTCLKCFTLMSNLKRHSLTHKGKILHQ